MIIQPSLMNTLSSSLLIFGVAFVAAMAVLLVHRKILPHYGVYIGSEANLKRGQGKKRRRR